MFCQSHRGAVWSKCLTSSISSLMETPGPQDEPVRVAIIGSGLAGLTAAYLLTSSTETVGQSLRIELLERNTRLGMDSESVTYEFQGQKCRIDVPMRAFSQGT